MSPANFPEISLNLFLEIDFFGISLVFSCFFSVWEMISWSVVSVYSELCLILDIYNNYMHLDIYLFWFPEDVC